MAKKKGKKKDTAAASGTEISEVDKTFYELQITDLNRKLARLREHATALEEKNEQLQQNFHKLDDDRGDVISYLKRNLQQKQSEVSELQERLTAIQELKEAEGKQHRKLMKELDHEFKQMRDQLTSEIKLITGKLNALEEFRQNREELMAKYEKQEHDIEQQEERHKRTIYEVEKKFILGKDAIKREMEAQVIRLATDFERANELRIAATTQRALRENIAVNRELNLLINENERIDKKNTEFLQENTDLKLRMDLLKDERNKALDKFRLQRGVLEQIREKNLKLAKAIETHKQIITRGTIDEENITHAHKRIEELEDKIKILEQNIHISRCQHAELKNVMESYNTVMAKFRHIFSTARDHVRAAMDVRTKQEVKDWEKHSVRENLIQTLLSLLTHTYEDFTAPTAKQLLPTAAYGQGNLGFVPKVYREKPKRITHKETEIGRSSAQELFRLYIGSELGETSSHHSSTSAHVLMSSETDGLEMEEEEEEEDPKLSSASESDSSSSGPKRYVLRVEDDDDDDEIPEEKQASPSMSGELLSGVELATAEEIYGEDDEDERRHQEILDALIGPFSFDDEPPETDTSPSED